MRGLRSHRIAVFGVVGLLLAACSGGGEPSSSSQAPTDSVGEPTTSSIVEESEPAPTTTTIAEVTESTVAEVTTTTEPPPEIVPLGVRWESSDSPALVAPQAIPQSLVAVDDDLWMFASRSNSTTVSRSSDAGITWQPVPIVAPPGSGFQSVNSVVVGTDGRLVAWGAIGSICQANIDVGEGYREVGICERFRPVLYLSDDDGVSWRQIEPAAMAPAGDTTVRLERVVATPTGYLAVGTVKGPDWHVRLWSSVDGETWALDREIRGDGAPISARDLLATGDEVVVLADEHPCATISYNTPGWYLGATWVNHLRIYSGTNSADLALLGAADHPFAHDPAPIECDPSADNLDQIAQLDAFYPHATGAAIGDVITMLETVTTVEEPDDADLLTSGSRRIAELIDGTWVLTEIEGVQSPNRASGSELFDVDGRPAIMETRSNGRVLIDIVPILPDGDGSWYQPAPEQSAIASRVSAGAWSAGALVVVGAVYADPYVTTITAENSLDPQLWRSVESTGPAAALCDLQAGGTCRFSDLSLVEGYPDFAGMDLSGADLSFTDFGDADFSGANFGGATLWEITTGEASSIDGADFTGARLPEAEIGNARGATFDGASLNSADLTDASGSSFAGADLQFASLSFSSLPMLVGAQLNYSDLEVIPPADGEPFEIALDGLDLTNADVDTVWDAPRLTITSLTGTILDGASFKNSDLTALDPTTVDLTDVDVWEDSICPDGLPPDDPPIGTCIR